MREKAQNEGKGKMRGKDQHESKKEKYKREKKKYRKVDEIHV